MTLPSACHERFSERGGPALTETPAPPPHLFSHWLACRPSMLENAELSRGSYAGWQVLVRPAVLAPARPLAVMLADAGPGEHHASLRQTAQTAQQSPTKNAEGIIEAAVLVNAQLSRLDPAFTGITCLLYDTTVHGSDAASEAACPRPHTPWRLPAVPALALWRLCSHRQAGARATAAVWRFVGRA